MLKPNLLAYCHRRYCNQKFFLINYNESEFLTMINACYKYIAKFKLQGTATAKNCD